MELLHCAGGYQKAIQALCPQVAVSVPLPVFTQRYSQKAAQAQRREKTLLAESWENSKQVAFELGLKG